MQAPSATSRAAIAEIPDQDHQAGIERVKQFTRCAPVFEGGMKMRIAHCALVRTALDASAMASPSVTKRVAGVGVFVDSALTTSRKGPITVPLAIPAGL